MSRVLASVSLLTLLATGCSLFGGSKAPCPDTQTLVEKIAAGNDQIVRLTVHATPPDGEQMIAIASTSDEKLGQPSDPEDLDAVAKGAHVTLAEGAAIDVTVPILMADGKYTAAAGVTLKGMGKADAEALAVKIAGEIEAGMKKKM